MAKKSEVTFEEFWQKYIDTFPGFANGAQIREICEAIAREAWQTASGESPEA